jgi:hypothetical protein
MLALAGALLLAILLAIVARRLPGLGSSTSPCTGGQDPKVEWRTTEAKPTFVPGHLFQIEPIGVPYLKLADIRTTGNRTYGDKCDQEWGHIHDPVYFAARDEGANAYFNNPARRVTDDSVEVVVTAVLAHPGPVAQAIQDRYFPEGRALMVCHVNPGSAAEAAGLRAADLLARFKGVDLRVGRQHEVDSIPIVANEAVEVLVIRAGQELTLSVVRQGKDKLGYNYGEVPLLEVTP